MTVLTTKLIQQICKEQNLYHTPRLNDKLYLNYQGISRLDGLEEYTGIQALFLNGNALTSLDGLAPLPLLSCLFVQNNALTTLDNLPQTLLTLDVASNQLSSLQGISSCLNLHTINASGNKLEDQQSISDLFKCTDIESIDLQDNHLSDLDGVLAALAPLKKLKCLYLRGNPCVTSASHYRKRVLGTLPQLLYLDERPIIDEERLGAAAWCQGGMEMERLQREECFNLRVAQQQRDFDALKRVQQEVASRQLARSTSETSVLRSVLRSTLSEEHCMEESNDGDQEVNLQKKEETGGQQNIDVTP